MTPHRPRTARRARYGVLATAGTALILALPGCGVMQGQDLPATVPNRVPDGDVEAGRLKVAELGCASCHAVPGVPSVRDGVGPALHDLDTRLYLAGQIPNRPEELIRWIRTPQAMVPGSLMPDTPMSEQDARDIAAYLYEQ